MPSPRSAIPNPRPLDLHGGAGFHCVLGPALLPREDDAGRQAFSLSSSPTYVPPKRSQRSRKSTSAKSAASKTRSKKRSSRRIRRTDEQRLADLKRELAELKARIEAGKSFSAEAVRRDRERLELSAADYAKLVGVSMLTVYNWEKGRSQARAKQVAQWRAVREMSVEEAWEQLGYEVD